MKFSSHGVFVLFLATIGLLLILSFGSWQGIPWASRIVIFMIIAFLYYFVQAGRGRKNNSGSGAEEQGLISGTSAQYSYLGLFRKGQLRIEGSALVFESNGIDDAGPFYTFPIDQIQSFRFESIQFSGDARMILTLKSGREEVFRVGSSGYWTSALEEIGLAEERL